MDICSGVSSFLFIPTGCKNIERETVQFCTVFLLAVTGRPPCFHKTPGVNLVVQDDTQEGIIYVDRAFVLDKA